MSRAASPRHTRIGLIQSRIRPTYEETVSLTQARIREAADKGAELIVLGELFTSRYFCQTEDPDVFALAEPLDGPTVTTMSALAGELGVSVVIPFFERRAPGLFHNTLVIAGPDGAALGVYRKMHIPDDPQFMEKYYFTPGDGPVPGDAHSKAGFTTISTSTVRVGPLICWDQWYPEAARLTAMRGAEILVYPTAIGWLPSEKAQEGAAQLSAWQTMQRSHAIANGLFVAAVNRVGVEGSPDSGIEFWGHSFVCDPMGRVIAEAGDDEEILIADLDLRLLEETRKWWPFFRDRRVDAYAALTKRWDEHS